MRQRLAAIAMLCSAALAVSGCVSERNADCEAASVRIELTLTADSLTPNDPSACRGQEVTLQVSSEVDGVFHMHGYDEEVPATPVQDGEVTTLTFTAARSGQFPIELHPGDDPADEVGVGVFTVNEP